VYVPAGAVGPPAYDHGGEPDVQEGVDDGGQVVGLPLVEPLAAEPLHGQVVEPQDRPVVGAVPAELALQRVDRRRLCGAARGRGSLRRSAVRAMNDVLPRVRPLAAAALVAVWRRMVLDHFRLRLFEIQLVHAIRTWPRPAAASSASVSPGAGTR